MPTILDTLAIQTCVVSYGKEASFAGTLASVTIQVTAKALGVPQLRLVWAATGDIFSSFTDTTTSGSGTPGIIVLPQTGQDGFRHGTTTFKDWYYEAVVVAVLADGQQLSRTYRFQIPAGTATLDLDMLDEDGVVTAMPTVAPAPTVTSVNGQTGAVTVTAGGDSDSEIAAIVKNPSSATATALSATYSPLTRFSGTVNPKEKGAAYNGTTGDSAAIATAFNTLKLDGTHATGRLKIDGPALADAPLVFDGGYAATEFGWTAGGNNGFHLDVTEGAIVAPANVGGALVTIKNFYGAKISLRIRGGGSFRSVTDAAISSGNGTVTSATAAFTSADVGRYIRVEGANDYGETPYTGLITGVTNSTTVTTTGTATTTVSGATAYVMDIGLHIENLINCDLDVDVDNFAGLALHGDSLGNGANYVTQSTIRNLYTRTCGQAIGFKQMQGGFGGILNLWDDNNTLGSIFDNSADTSILKYENFSPTTQKIGVSFSNCNNFYIGLISLGDRPTETLLKIVGGDFGHIDKVRVGGIPGTTAGTGTIDGFRLVEVKSIHINEVSSFRCNVGLRVKGGGQNGIQIGMHHSLSADTTSLQVEAGPATTAPILDIGVHHRFDVNPIVLGALTGGVVKVHGHMDSTIFQGGASGHYAIASSSAGILDVAGLTVDTRSLLAGLTNHTGTLRGTLMARYSNGSPAKGTLWYADGAGNLTQLAPGSTGQVPTYQADGTLTPAQGGASGVYAAGAAVTLTNSTTETLVGGPYTIPANSVVAGTTYRVTAWGFVSNAAGDTVTLRLHLGGVTGSSLAATLPITNASALTSRSFFVQYLVTFRGTASTATPLTVSDFGHNSTSSAVADGVVNTSSFNMTVARDLVIGATWSAASASDILEVDGCLIEKVY